VSATDIQSLRDFFRLLLHLICRCAPAAARSPLHAQRGINLKARFKLLTCLLKEKTRLLQPGFLY
jgi:hypothetical protein